MSQTVGMAGASARRTLLLALWLLVATGVQAVVAGDRTGQGDAERKLHTLADGVQPALVGRVDTGADADLPALLAPARTADPSYARQAATSRPALAWAPRRWATPLAARAPPVSAALA